MHYNLYDLTSDLAIINNDIADAGGELTAELESLLDAAGLAVKDKIQSIGKWTLNLNSKVEAIDKEIERLQHNKKMAENLNTRLKDYVKMCMTRAEIGKLEFTTFTVAIQKNPPSVEIVNEEAVPNAYKTIKQVVSVDKRRILEDLKTGEKIEGCSLISNKTHLKIK